MLNKIEITYWNEKYNSTTYPTNLYKELVIDQTPNVRKFELLGAWKTGCIRLSDTNIDFTDNCGLNYRFTNRWGVNSPVGYNNWLELTNNQEKLLKEVPSIFPEKPPKIFDEMIQKKGFGFIWASFVLHSIYPEVYPLYDQHVYRAFIKSQYPNQKSPQTAKTTWSAYTEYRSFFIKQSKDVQLPYWIVDRALWTYGKHLKKEIEKVKSAKSQTKIQNKEVAMLDLNHLKWVSENTLGGKEKPFFWYIDENCNMIIQRIMKNGDDYLLKATQIKSKDLESLIKYVSDNDWVHLANNVQRLNDNTEIEGIGWFLFKNLKWNQTDSQLASHIAAIFTKSNIWDYNGKKRGMKFKTLQTAWKSTLKKYYDERETVILPSE